jgi:hypothetical protein
VTNALRQAMQITGRGVSGRWLTVVDANGITTTLALRSTQRMAQDRYHQRMQEESKHSREKYNEGRGDEWIEPSPT